MQSDINSRDQILDEKQQETLEKYLLGEVAEGLRIGIRQATELIDRMRGASVTLELESLDAIVTNKGRFGSLRELLQAAVGIIENRQEKNSALAADWSRVVNGDSFLSGVISASGVVVEEKSVINDLLDDLEFRTAD